MKNPYLLERVMIDRKTYDYTNIPECKGIYFIFNNLDELIYIGHSNNIRKRVVHHLYGYSNWELYIQAAKLAWVEFLGDRTELEAQYIKRHKPILNVVHTCGG